MKNYLIILLIGFMTIIQSCSEHMDLRPDTKIILSPSLFESESSLTSYSNQFYNFIDYNAIMLDNNSDNLEHISAPPAVRTTLYVKPTALGSGGWNWGNLRTINYFIENVSDHTTDPELKNKYMALGRFFRAWFYFDKVKAFGDVPWYSKPLSTTDEGLYKARDSRVLVVDSILSDLDFAIQHLDEQKKKNSITKWTALALKSRITLFEGTWRHYHTQSQLPGANELLRQCIESSRELIDAGVYTLFTTDQPAEDYKNMFLASEANTDEVILARSSSNLYTMWTRDFTSTSNGNFGATHSLVADYPNLSDGKSYYDSKNGNVSEIPYYEEFQDRDYRLAHSIKAPGYIRPGTTSESTNDFAQNRTGYQVVKRVGPPTETQGGDNRDIILIRYAEILLNYAEARAILGEFNQDDLDRTLNPIRRRAGLSALELPLQTDALQQARYRRTQSAEILEIGRERRIELAFEGLRRDDLRRWHEGHLFRTQYEGIYIPGFDQYIDLDRDGNDDVYIVPQTGTFPSNRKDGVFYLRLSSHNGLSDGDEGRLVPYKLNLRDFEEWEYLNPIPVEEISLNPNLTQNPGWDQVQ